MLRFQHREPIGSSTFPMPGNKVDMGEALTRLHRPAGGFNRATVYLHIPFCDQICSFCGFNKAVSSEETKERYVTALVREIELYATRPYVQDLRIDAVYFGGGTPNALNAEQLARILQTLHRNLPLAAAVEITCEGTLLNFTDERIAALKENGVNRVSAGIQTYDRSIREAHLHMRNGEEELLAGIDHLRANFDNFNLDYIYNLPGQSDQTWERDIILARQSGATHLTIYPLVVLENTIFFADYVKNRKYAAPDEGREIAMFRDTLRMLEGSPYSNRYSVRDWAVPGRDCRYIRMNAESNLILAFGAGAHGYLAGFTYRTIRSTVRYMEHIETTDAIPLEAMCVASEAELMQRYAVMGLRMRNLDLEPFQARFGKPFLEVFERQVGELVEAGYLVINDGRIEFTEPGDIWANNVRTHFEGVTGHTVGYSDTTSIGEDGKTHYSKITRIKASGDVEANL